MFRGLFSQAAKSELLQAAVDNVTVMLSNERRMIEAATDYLFDGKEPEIDIRLLDKEINIEERIIRRLVFEHLTFNSNQELTGSLVLISIVHDVERIGDYAKGILGLVETHGPLPTGNIAADSLRASRVELFEVYDLAQDAFENDDPEKAVACVRLSRENERISKKLVRVTLDDPAVDKNQGILISSASRMLRRVSAHLANIASSVSHPFDKIGGKADEAV